MNQLFTSLLIITFLVNCGNSSQKKATQTTTTQPQNSTNSATIAQQNYAVIWEWTTSDKKLVDQNAPTFTEELLNLWENNIIENVYFDNKPQENTLHNFPSISFFLKANTLEEATSTLNNLSVVKLHVANYKIFPVGMLWLNILADMDYDRGNKQCYVAVWTSTNDTPPTNDLLKAQNDTVLAMWNKGLIENVYFDSQGVVEQNNKTDFVFFVYANSESEARNKCETLPFYKNKIASYQLYKAGILWLGKNETLNQ